MLATTHPREYANFTVSFTRVDDLLGKPINLDEVAAMFIEEIVQDYPELVDSPIFVTGVGIDLDPDADEMDFELDVICTFETASRLHRETPFSFNELEENQENDEE